MFMLICIKKKLYVIKDKTNANQVHRDKRVGKNGGITVTQDLFVICDNKWSFELEWSSWRKIRWSFFKKSITKVKKMNK